MSEEKIVSKPATKEYCENWEVIWGEGKNPRRQKRSKSKIKGVQNAKEAESK